MITCSMCGTVFNPAEHVRCQGCPLHQGCQLVCCPNCGFEMVNLEKSGLARLVQRLINKSSPVPVERSETC